jgi:hypothetical protein
LDDDVDNFDDDIDVDNFDDDIDVDNFDDDIDVDNFDDDIDNFNNDNFVKPVHYTKPAAAHSFKQVRIFLKANPPF